MHRRYRLAAFASTAALLMVGADPARAQNSEVVTLLQDLVRVNTSNPPGNEAQIAELLRTRLEPLGFQIEIVPTPTPGKAHFIARLPATAPDGRKPLLLAGHEDVVGVERPLWTVDPFAAVIRGDRLYGRGAMDFKGGLAAFTVAAMRLARAGTPRTRDLILLAEADEEGGSLRHHLARREPLGQDRRQRVDQRGRLDLRGRVRRRAADGRHDDRQELAVGDVPHARDLDALVPAAPRQRAAPARPRARSRRALRHRAAHHADRAHLPARLGEGARAGATARRLRAITTTRSPAVRRRLADQLRDGRWGELFDGLTRNIFVPTIVAGGFRANVLPGTAEATVNMRMLPGQKPRPLIRELRRAVADPKVKITPIVSGDATVKETLDAFDKRARRRPTTTDTDLYRTLAREGRRQWPEAVVTPALFEAGTDATPWRQRGSRSTASTRTRSATPT